MEKSEKFQRVKIGGSEHINQNCWLVKTLNYNPYQRCRYCELKFRKCLFLHYQIISLILIFFLFVLSFLIEGRISELIIISVFILVIAYGYFFNKSTDKIIQANFSQRKAKEALEELAERLEQKVEEQTREIKDAYKKLEKAYEELKVLDRAKSEFISIASHQLRTPLTIIKGFLSMAIEGNYGQLNSDIKDRLEKSYDSAERLVKLVDALLDLSHMEGGKMKFDFSKVNFSELTTNIVEELSPQAEKKKLSFKFEKPKENYFVWADEQKLRQVIMNLIDNAIKYTESGGVKVWLGRQDGFVQFSVKDTGLGMIEEEISNLFQKFVRGANAPRLYTEGAGIGLYVAKKLIEEHKGQVWAESAGEDKGSTFFVRLPEYKN